MRGSAVTWVKERYFFELLNFCQFMYPLVPLSVLCGRSVHTYFPCELILTLISKVFSSPSLALDLQTHISHHVLDDCISLSCYHLQI